jgi:hypothetical protein
LNPDYSFIMNHCTIRPNKTLESYARVETAWKLEIGVFKDYIKDNSIKLERKCFEFDWENMKVLKYKNSDADEVKEEMWRVYPMLREAYKVQAGYSPNGNVFSIGMNQVSLFLGEMECLDEDDYGKLKSTDADRMFITVNANRRGPTNPANCLIRLQLMEFVIRCAMEKFYASGAEKIELAAIKRFNNQFLIPVCKKYK